MDITAVAEKADMMGGPLLFELTFSPDEGSAVGLDMRSFHEAYDTHVLWVWSQSDLDTCLEDDGFWTRLSEDLEYNGIPTPGGEELRRMARERIASGNVDGFSRRFGR